MTLAALPEETGGNQAALAGQESVRQLERDGRAKAMLSYKKKNYALLGYDERITVKGSSLSSRSLEKFGRNFLTP